jgi:hypothetical protein
MTTLPGETGAGSAPAGHPDDGGPPAVRVRGLVKTYSGVRAVNGIDLDIRRGEIFAVLQLGTPQGLNARGWVSLAAHRSGTRLGITG